MVLGILVGTRPELIKMAPVIWQLQKRSIPFVLLHSGQHRDANMSQVFFDALQLPEPDAFLDAHGTGHAEKTGSILVAVENAILAHDLSLLVVEGDTNTVLAGALSAKKCGLQVAHVEAGARSFDRRMPEEINRVLTDHISDFLFAPTRFCQDNLRREGLTDSVLSGNTELETLEFARPRARIPFDVPDSFGLVTIHRQENTTPDALSLLPGFLSGLPGSKVFLVHPRTRRMISELHISFDSSVLLCDPAGYFELVGLLDACSYVVTDSGGLQNEAAALHKPVVIARENTEWLDVVQDGFGALVGFNAQSAKKANAFLNGFVQPKTSWPVRPASSVIVDALCGSKAKPD